MIGKPPHEEEPLPQGWPRVGSVSFKVKFPQVGPDQPGSQVQTLPPPSPRVSEEHSPLREQQGGGTSDKLMVARIAAAASNQHFIVYLWESEAKYVILYVHLH